MQEQLENLLDEICMPSNLIGYQYWIDITRLAISLYNGTYSFDMMQLYCDVAKLHNSKYTLVERDLRYAKKLSTLQVKSNAQFLAELVKIYNRRYK